VEGRSSWIQAMPILIGYFNDSPKIIRLAVTRMKDAMVQISRIDSAFPVDPIRRLHHIPCTISPTQPKTLQTASGCVV
jgi:hypothetical protein